MPQCVGVKKNGVRCGNDVFGNRCCGVHVRQELTARPDITDAGGPIPNLKKKRIDPYYLTRCMIYDCINANRLGEYTCEHHERLNIRVMDGLDWERELKTPYFCSIIREQITRKAELQFNAEFQLQIRNHQEQVLRRQEQLRRERLARLNERAVQHIAQQRPPEDAEGRWVFERDPEGGVNLRALAQDHQSVHRSSVQEEALKNIEHISKVPIKAPLFPDLWYSSYVEFLTELSDEKLCTNEEYEQARFVLYEETPMNMSSFNITYIKLFDHVWSYVFEHKDKKEMMRRMVEEVIDSRGMCSNGRIARLVNALQGFMDGLETPVDKMEVFSSKFAKLMELPKMKRVVAALELFKEYEIAEDKQEEWFMPLVEA